MIKHPVDDIEKKENLDSPIYAVLSSLNIPISLYKDRYNKPIHVARNSVAKVRPRVGETKASFLERKKQHKLEKKIWKFKFREWVKKEEEKYWETVRYPSQYPPRTLAVKAWLRNGGYSEIPLSRRSKILENLEFLYDIDKERYE